MTCPPLGLTLPAAYVSVRDVDTPVVSIPGSAFVWAIRLIGVWGPELRSSDEKERQVAHAGKKWLEETLSESDPAELRVQIPLPEGKNLLSSLTFDRIPAYLWLGNKRINDVAVQLGYASSVKGGMLGA